MYLKCEHMQYCLLNQKFIYKIAFACIQNHDTRSENHNIGSYMIYIICLILYSSREKTEGETSTDLFRIVLCTIDLFRIVLCKYPISFFFFFFNFFFSSLMFLLRFCVSSGSWRIGNFEKDLRNLLKGSSSQIV